MTIAEQLTLSEVAKSSYYYQAIPERTENILIMEAIDKIYTKRPYYGSRKLIIELKKIKIFVNRKRVSLLMKKMGIETQYRKPNLSKLSKAHKKYPYLLKNFTITSPMQVWSIDITYMPLRGGFLYLVAIIDWYSRYVISWRLSNTLDVRFCLEALEEAFSKGRPKIFNSDQRTQFTCEAFIKRLEREGVQISMDGRGRAFDNIFIERLWRSVKYEDVYIKRYESGEEAHASIKEYMKFYNEERIHQALGYKTPAEIHGIA